MSWILGLPLFFSPHIHCRKKSREGWTSASHHTTLISKDVAMCKAVREVKKNFQMYPRTKNHLSLFVRGRKIQDEYRQSKAISSKTVFPHTKQTLSPTITHAGATLE